METTPKISKGRLWASYILQGIVVLMFLMGAIFNIMQTEGAIEGATQLGYPAESVLYLGIVLLVCTLLYVYPKTAMIGAILLTAWLGGAVATHVIHQDPAFNTLLPVIFGIAIWLSLLLRYNSLNHVFFGPK